MTEISGANSEIVAARPHLAMPELSIVVLIGASGSGKSTFARAHFKPTEVISSDFCRGLVADDENDQTVSSEAFDVLHYIAAKRLAAGRLVVIDATNVSQEGRKPLLELGRKYHAIMVAIVFNMPEALCHERNATRPDRDFGPHVVRRHTQQLRRSIPNLKREGFRYITVLRSPEEVAQVEVERQPLWNNLKHEHGPFDIIGDVHGCFEELHALLDVLGYKVSTYTGGEGVKLSTVSHPEGRKAIFLGDLVDRGPDTPGVLRLVMDMVRAGSALCVPGNHDIKLMRALQGKHVRVAHGLAESLAQIEDQSLAFKEEAATFINSLISHYVLDDGKLVVAHAGLKEEMQGRGSGTVRDFALYGETTGETDEFGLPVRYNWAADYRGRAMVVYGHTPVPEPEWLNNTINIDTGCAMGGKLTALRYPERTLVSVPALKTYYDSPKPFLPVETEDAASLSAQHQHDDVLDVADVLGKRYLTTRLNHNILIREENAIAALEVMSRFAVNPRWLIYLPPTMSPTETTKVEGLLEHPAEAFAYYQSEGITRVVCQEKHMGSRAVVIVCRDEAAARRRFGIVGEGTGKVYTRTGRPFFADNALEVEFLARVCAALSAASIWDELQTDWVCLDCELMPWSAKAQELLRNQYAAVGAAGRSALSDAVSALSLADISGTATADAESVKVLLNEFRERDRMMNQYVDAYRHYCWPVNSLSDLKLAPFHLLASESGVHTDKDHIWHMEALARICREDERLLVATPYKLVELDDEASILEGISWWTELTGRGGEGMVVKPLDFIAQGRHGVTQPAIKCRGPEYLRIIYGPEYTSPANLSRLRSRHVGGKRALAYREFALGIESLERFVRGDSLRLVHECVFGVLALESEPVDPRL